VMHLPEPVKRNPEFSAADALDHGAEARLLGVLAACFNEPQHRLPDTRRNELNCSDT